MLYFLLGYTYPRNGLEVLLVPGWLVECGAGRPARGHAGDGDARSNAGGVGVAVGFGGGRGRGGASGRPPRALGTCCRTGRKGWLKLLGSSSSWPL